MISEVDLRDWGNYPQRPIESKEQYEHYLKHHDWFYEQSDDQSVWRRGVKAQAYLMEARGVFDLNYELWEKYGR